MERRFNFAMQLVKLAVCISVLLPKICFAGLIAKTRNLNESLLIDATLDILESCYADRLSTVGLAGPSAGSIMTKISSRDPVIPVTVIDESSRVERHDPVHRGSRHKLRVFVITAFDPDTLTQTLTQVKSSKWWNHMASFLLIGLPITENRCSSDNGANILWAGWKMNVLNSIFVCLHETRGHLIYTFNPFTSKAPVPWQQENTWKTPNNHFWTWFVRENRENESSCDGLEFDKTIDLGGYPIRASVKGMEAWWSKDPDQDVPLFNRVQNVTAQVIMSSLNATWILEAQPWNDLPLINYELNVTYGVTEMASNGFTDVCLDILIDHSFINFETTYPLYESEIVIVTQYPRNKSQLEKIISVLDVSSRWGVLVVLMITLIFFKFFLDRPIISAILHIVLLICNTGLPRIPERLAPRIYLCALFMFVVTIQGIYQSQFASMLTKDVRLRTIESIDDLAKSGHIIYGGEAYRSLFNQSAFEGRYVTNVFWDCVANVVRNSKAACVEVRESLIQNAAQYNLHLSRDPIGHMYGVYLIRPDWPLEEKVNKIVERAAAGNIVKTLYRPDSGKLMNIIKAYENKDQDPEPRVLTLKQLEFAFVILGIGLTCATITFIIEVAVGHKVTANLRNRIRR